MYTATTVFTKHTNCSPGSILGRHFGIILPITSFGKQINKLSLMSLSLPEEDKGTWKTPCESLSYGKLWSPDLCRLSNCLWASGGNLRNKSGKKNRRVNICRVVRETKSTHVYEVVFFLFLFLCGLPEITNYLSKLPGPHHTGHNCFLLHCI